VHARIQAFNKDRLVQVEFAPSPPTPRAAPRPANSVEGAATEQPSASPTTADGGRGTLPWLLLAVGAASVGTGAGFAVWGHNSEAELRDSCAPHCTDSQVQRVHTQYLLSDISFGVGLISLSAATYLFLRHPGTQHQAHGALPVTVVASPSGLQASYGASF